MAKYLVLIYGDEQRWANRTDDEWEVNHDGHRAFQEAAGSGVLGGHRLENSSTATSLRAGAGTPTITDGPFLETKEALGGFYVVEATDLDEVIRWSSLLRETKDDHSGIEVRPIMEPS
jgi:hypothetical protein